MERALAHPPPPGACEGADPDLVARALSLIVDACRPERIWLFGSRARGEGRPGSDLDLLAVVRDAEVPAARRAAPGALHGLGADIGLDVHVWGHSPFHDRLHLRASFPASVVRDGIILYEEHSMSVADAREWLERAEEDLLAARALHDLSPPQVRSSITHLQQAVEKAAKGLMALHDLSFRPVHALEPLAEGLAGHEPALAAGVGEFFWLTELAGSLRYPSGETPPEIPDVSDVAGWIPRVAAIVEGARARVEERAG